MKKLYDEIARFLQQDASLRKNTNTKAVPLPENCYFLPGDAVICYPRVNGDSRYPYCADGLTLWAHSSGYMSVNESTFYCVLPSSEGKEPYAAFFGGVKHGENFVPVSITGTARQPRENVRRFTVYTPTAVYYVAKRKRTCFYLRAFMTPDKKVVFTIGATNNGSNSEQIYLATYLNFLFMHQAGEGPETQWFKKSSVVKNNYVIETVEDLDRYTHIKNFGAVSVNVPANLQGQHTCSRADFVGGKNNCLACAEPLFTGKFGKCNQTCNFTDTAIVGDMYHTELGAGESVSIDYVMEICPTREAAFAAAKDVENDYAENVLYDMIARDKRKHKSVNMLKIRFSGTKEGKIDAKTFTEYVSHVQRQTEFAALAKNSGVSLLGVRDVMQQLEAALMWNAEDCRAKILETLNYVDPSGRAPRQYSIPAKDAVPAMDTREFIDQGNWIISTIYTYLAHTGDYTILDEKCGYYKIVGHNRVEKVEERNSVYEHLVRIADFMLKNIDEKTNCLKILYGDWNDAVDGLGMSSDGSAEYGSGVSVMATLHFYRNLQQLAEITQKYGDKFAKLETYRQTRKQIEKGIMQYCIEKKGDERKILHGWGDKRAYTVGGFCDMDGLSRDALTVNAFWVICGAYLLDKSIKKDILAALSRLDDKYGFRTFYPGFAEDAKGVGRIVNLPLGTAENAATYVHAAMFGTWSLFGMNESKAGWKQLEKVIPITHDYLSATPFVACNSYSYNPEAGYDGESMSDWFTGSANALVKLLVWYVFGVKCDLDGVTISPATYLPFEKAELSMRIRGRTVKVAYSDQKNSKREFTVNGKKAKTFTAANDLQAIRIKFEDLVNCEITVTD